MTKPHSVGIAIDVGGTKVGLAAFDESGAILQHRTILQTEIGQSNPSQAIANKAAKIAEAVGREHVSTVSLDAPGNPGSGDSFAPNNPGWTFPQSVKDLSAMFPTATVTAANDVNAAALAEYTWGGWSAHSLVYLNLGTGFAGGAVINGDIITGSHGLGLELGYLIPTTQDASQGAASKIAPTEDILSGGGLETAALHAVNRQVSAARVLSGHDADQSLLNLRRAFRIELCNVAANMAIVFDPDVVVLGGGLAQFCRPFLDDVQQNINEFVPYPMPICVSSFPAYASLLGSVALGLQLMGVQPTSASAKVLKGIRNMI